MPPEASLDPAPSPYCTESAISMAPQLRSLRGEATDLLCVGLCERHGRASTEAFIALWKRFNPRCNFQMRFFLGYLDTAAMKAAAAATAAAVVAAAAAVAAARNLKQ